MTFPLRRAELELGLDPRFGDVLAAWTGDRAAQMLFRVGVPLAEAGASPRRPVGWVTPRQHRRVETEQRLLNAAWQILTDQGVAAIGVNSIAEAAGADKVLIYLYFGGLPGLLERCAEERDFWPTVDELLGPDRVALSARTSQEAAHHVLGRYVAGLRARPATLQIVAFEMVDRNELTMALERVREARSLALMQQLAEAGLLRSAEHAILGALFSAAINTLVVRGRGLGVFAGVDIQSEASWARIVAAMASAF